MASGVGCSASQPSPRDHGRPCPARRRPPVDQSRGAGAVLPRSVEALPRAASTRPAPSRNRLRVSQVHPASGFSDEDVLQFARPARPPARCTPPTPPSWRAPPRLASSSAPRGARLVVPFPAPVPASVRGTELTLKGAPEVVLACTGAGPAIKKSVAALAADGLRVIAVARHELTAAPTCGAWGEDPEPEEIAEYCHDGLTFVGLLGYSDTRVTSPPNCSPTWRRPPGCGSSPATTRSPRRSPGNRPGGSRRS